jgi:hypothetical protein
VEARSVTYAPITVEARRALLDALDALSDQRAALVLVGAQAIYIYTGEADVAMMYFQLVLSNRIKDIDF